MSTLELEIVEEFHLLAPDAKRRVLDRLSLEMESAFDYDAWWQQVETLQKAIRSRLGNWQNNSE